MLTIKDFFKRYHLKKGNTGIKVEDGAICMKKTGEMLFPIFPEVCFYGIRVYSKSTRGTTYVISYYYETNDVSEDKYQIRFYISSTGQKAYIQNKIDFWINFPHYYREKTKDKDLYIKMVNEYFQSAVDNAKEENEIITHVVGWTKITDEIEYLPISDYDGLKDKYTNAFFNAALIERENFELRYLEKSVKKIKKAVDMLDKMLSYSSVKLIFLYTVMALSESQERKLNKRYNNLEWWEEYSEYLFSLCVHSKDEKVRTVVVNLFSNIFTYYEEKFASFRKNDYSISLNSITHDVEQLAPLYDVPVIIYKTTKSIERNAKTIKDIECRRKEGDYGFWPVYVNDKGWEADEIMDISLDGVEIQYDGITEVKKVINFLLYNYIRYQRCILRDNAQNNHRKKSENYEQDLRNPYMVFRYNQLFFAGIRFYKYIQQDVVNSFECEEVKKSIAELAEKHFSSKQLERSYVQFLRNNEMVLVDSDEEKNVEDLMSFILYVRYLYELEETPKFFIKDYIIKGVKYCLLGYSSWYTEYIKYCTKKGIIPVDKRVLQKKLKESPIVKTNGTGKRLDYSMRLNDSKESINVIRILIDNVIKSKEV